MDVQYKSSNFLQKQKIKILTPDIKPNDENNIKYQLVENMLYEPNLGDLNVYLPNFLELLWNQPTVVSKILLNSNSKEISENLSFFFCHNFYENVLSPNYIEANLLYLIAIMLKEEVNNIPKKTSKDAHNKYLEYFLDNGPICILLEQFQKKNDVQNFFNTILLNIIEDLERNCSNRDLVFDINKIEKEVDLRKNNNKSLDSRSQSRNLDINLSTNSLNCMTEKRFFNDYITNMNSNYFNKKIEECKKDNNSKNIEFFLYYLNVVDDNDKKILYNSDIFEKKNIDNSREQEVLDEYITNFDKVINLINDLLKNLLDNLYLLPYSIKCICKIIFSLIQKRFHFLNIFQQYTFISKFFFEKLFSPIFQNPSLGALINSFIISTTTLKNLEEINKIFLMFTSGDLFKAIKDEENYTPFNSYFISKIDSLFKFYEEITKVELPSFIQKLINDELDPEYEYDFFKENPEELVHHISACFTLEEIYAIIELMEKNKKNIFGVIKGNEDKYDNLLKLQKTFEKISSKRCKEILKKAKNQNEHEIIKVPVYNKKKTEIKEYKEVKGRKIIKYYLIYKINFKKEYSNLINITQDKKFFNIKELKTDEINDIGGNDNEKNEIEQNKIIKVKNLFCTILYNVRMLLKTDFEEDKISNIINILKELKKLMRSSNNLINVTFPSQWYIDNLIDYLDKIPKEYLENNCELLINEIQKDVNESIKSINFEDLSILIDKMKYATRGKNFYENVINLVTDMNINKNAQNIIEKDNLEIEIMFKNNEPKKEKELKIYKPAKSAINLQYFDNILETPKQKGTFICHSIKAFTKSFPNILRAYKKYKRNEDVFKFQKDLKVSKEINSFFKIIREQLKKDLNNISEKEFENLIDKIYDYVMEKLYEKIYPKNISKEDDKIYNICIKLKDNESGYFIKKKNSHLFDSFLPDLTNYLLQIEKEKSVRKKILNLKAIFETMDELSSFNGGEGLDMDTQIQILNYAMVKAQPKNIYTNYRFMELFIGDNKNDFSAQKLMELKLVCEHLLNQE
jgi:hypothetical protein